MLNILPPELKRENKLKNIYFNLKKTAVMIFIILLIPTILLISNYLLFNNIIAGLEIESPVYAAQKQNIDNTKNNISSFNTLLQKSTKIQGAHINPVILIDHFSTLIPQNTIVQSLNISLTDSKINFTGYANSRDDLIQLQNNLSSDTVFTDFSYPINPLSEKENIYFDFTGKINLSSETLKKYADEE